jgi:hypothetical protein
MTSSTRLLIYINSKLSAWKLSAHTGNLNHQSHHTAIRRLYYQSHKLIHLLIMIVWSFKVNSNKYILTIHSFLHIHNNNHDVTWQQSDLGKPQAERTSPYDCVKIIRAWVAKVNMSVSRKHWPVLSEREPCELWGPKLENLGNQESRTKSSQPRGSTRVCLCQVLNIIWYCTGFQGLRSGQWNVRWSSSSGQPIAIFVVVRSVQMKDTERRREEQRDIEIEVERQE